MKHINLFESFLTEFEDIKISLNNYINKFYISKTSFGKFFISDATGKLIIEVASKSKYGYTKLEYFIDYFKSGDNKFPSTIKILLELLNKKFPKIKIKNRMSKAELNIRLFEIKRQISDLEREKSEVEKKLIELSDSFIEKFKVWYTSDQGYEDGYLPSRDKFPLFRKFLNSGDYNRYQTYTIEDVIGEENMYVFLNYDKAIQKYEDSEVDDIIIKYRPYLEEVMKGNLKSFIFDW